MRSDHSIQWVILSSIFTHVIVSPPAFYQLALLDGLSFNAKEQKYGPNGGVIYAVLNTKEKETEYISNLKDAAEVLIQAEKDLNWLYKFKRYLFVISYTFHILSKQT